MDGHFSSYLLECLDPTQKGNLASKPSGAVVIRKCYSGEASTFSLLYSNRPISLLIFSGAIVLTAQTIEIVPRIQGKEKCVVHLHKFQFVWRQLQVTNQQGCKIRTVIDYGFQFVSMLLSVCVWKPSHHLCRNTISFLFK